MLSYADVRQKFNHFLSSCCYCCYPHVNWSLYFLYWPLVLHFDAVLNINLASHNLLQLCQLSTETSELFCQNFILFFIKLFHGKEQSYWQNKVEEDKRTFKKFCIHSIFTHQCWLRKRQKKQHPATPQRTWQCFWNEGQSHLGWNR